MTSEDRKTRRHVVGCDLHDTKPSLLVLARSLRLFWRKKTVCKNLNPLDYRFKIVYKSLNISQQPLWI